MPAVKTIFGVMKTIKNWPIFFLDFFNLINREDIVILRNEIKYKVRSKSDRLILNDIWIHRVYTPKGFEICERDLVVDIGAHIGVFSIFASNFAKKGKIYAFEPESENFKMLKRNIRINNIKNIIPINKAISNKKGNKELLISESNTGTHSFHIIDDKAKKIKVQTTSLQDFIQENNIEQIDFLKMDCEGEEYNILFNCPDNVLKIIKKISMEYHNIDNSHIMFSLKKFLEKNGFDVVIKLGHFKMLYATNKD